MTNTNRNSWTRLFPLVWLVFLSFPIAGLVNQPRPIFDYVYGFFWIAIFVALFFWTFFWVRFQDLNLEQPYQIPSLIGMISSYAIMGLLWWVTRGDSIGFLVYAGSFAGFQKSIRPALFSIVIAFSMTTYFALNGSGWLIWSVPISTIIASLGNHMGYQEMISRRKLRRSQEEVTRIAKIAERERIARDLHDLLGHTLSVIVLKSELASKLAEKNPARAIQEIRDVERISREALQEVRSAVRGYRSSGLEAELANISLALEAAQIKFEHYITPLALEWATEQTLAFILREAITNVVRHSHAKTCFVSLEQGSNSVILEIFDDAQFELKEGNGIRGMRERVAALQGEFSLVTSSGKHGISLKIVLSNAPEANPLSGKLELNS
jgi:two-component system sensor histidine kinase DesK